MFNTQRAVTAHAYTDEAIAHALDNGVKGIEHGNLASKQTLERMAAEGASISLHHLQADQTHGPCIIRSGIFLTPTLSCYGIMVRKPFENFLSADGATCRDPDLTLRG